MISRSASASPTKVQDTSKEASWASLQRALDAAKVAQHQRAQDRGRSMSAMLPPDLPHQITHSQDPVPTSRPGLVAPKPEFAEWSNAAARMNNWSSPSAHEAQFDFGFDQTDISTTASLSHGSISHGSLTNSSPDELPHQTYLLSPDDWEENMDTPKGNSFQQTELNDVAHTHGLPIPAYPSSRRESTSDELTAGFGTFALGGTPPRVTVAAPMGAPDGGLDIAARRKRPRPTPLTSGSLRSRSFGAPNSASPTTRPGVTPPSTHTIRHVKSTGHSLNARFAGIRKSSSAQRSPLNVSFAEAEAFNRLMAQQAIITQKHQVSAMDPPSTAPLPMTSPELYVNTHMSMAENGGYDESIAEMLNNYQMQGTQQYAHATTSPPGTPYQAEFMLQNQNMGMMPPVSAPPQFASFPEYTPPYSAGPLTNSSWSDAPLGSPELSGFPQVTYIPSLNYAQSSEALSAQFQQFVLPSDNTSDVRLGSISDQKKTEFFIQEFPGQKEEHAQVAQQLAQQKPRNYVFANSAPDDYGQV